MPIETRNSPNMFQDPCFMCQGYSKDTNRQTERLFWRNPLPYLPLVTFLPATNAQQLISLGWLQTSTAHHTSNLQSQGPPLPGYPEAPLAPLALGLRLNFYLRQQSLHLPVLQIPCPREHERPPPAPPKKKKNTKNNLPTVADMAESANMAARQLFAGNLLCKGSCFGGQHPWRKPCTFRSQCQFTPKQRESSTSC